jgi:hypothetical protein
VPASVKTLIRKIIPKGIWVSLKEMQRQLTFNSSGPYSDDQWITESIIKNKLGKKPGIYIDIGAQDGITGSQTLFLARLGWKGVLFECDPEWVKILRKYYCKFNDTVTIVEQQVTPQNIVELIENRIGASDVDFLSIDIDSFDYYVLDALLKKYKPKVICTEINELFPPPIRFTVLPEAKTLWRGDAFQGYSLQLGFEIAEKHGYKVSALHFNNLFLEKSDSATGVGAANAEKIYFDGYIARSGRNEKFRHNRKYEMLIGKRSDEIINYFNNEFKDRKGEYTIEV